jgi:hypothetical protein
LDHAANNPIATQHAIGALMFWEQKLTIGDESSSVIDSNAKLPLILPLVKIFGHWKK